MTGDSELQALSPAGRCKSFEASADGYGRGEGFAALVLRGAAGPPPGQPPPQLRGEDLGGATGGTDAATLALVRGSAVNQDGRSSSLTAPNGPAQQVSEAAQSLQDPCAVLLHRKIPPSDSRACCRAGTLQKPSLKPLAVIIYRCGTKQPTCWPARFCRTMPGLMSQPCPDLQPFCAIHSWSSRMAILATTMLARWPVR